MRVTGRTVRPSTLAERRLLLALGIHELRVPRSKNPFAVARRLSRMANGEVEELKKLISPTRPPRPRPSPDQPIPYWPTHAK